MKLEIKLALVRSGKSLDDVARHIGRSKALVSLILNEKHKGYSHRPTIRRLLKLRQRDLPDRRQPRGGKAA
jgi:transcriptional regulator with XRE-family HTH domain